MSNHPPYFIHRFAEIPDYRQPGRDPGPRCLCGAVTYLEALRQWRDRPLLHLIPQDQIVYCEAPAPRKEKL